MFPMQRTWEPAGAAARRFGRTEAAVRIGHLQEVARRKEGRSSSFWPRTPRRTFLPADAVPLRPDGAKEPREGDYEEEDGDEEEEELGGVEESKRELFWRLTTRLRSPLNSVGFGTRSLLYAITLNLN